MERLSWREQEQLSLLRIEKQIVKFLYDGHGFFSGDIHVGDPDELQASRVNGLACLFISGVRDRSRQIHRPDAFYEAIAALERKSEIVRVFLSVIANVQQHFRENPSMLLSSHDALIHNPPLDISVLVPIPQFSEINAPLTLPRNELLTRGIICAGENDYYSLNSNSKRFHAALFPAIYQHGEEEYTDRCPDMKPSDFIRQRLLSVDDRHRRNPFFLMFHYDKAQKMRILGVQRKTYQGWARGAVTKRDIQQTELLGVPVHSSVKDSPGWWYCKQLDAQLLMRKSPHKPGAFVTLTENYGSAIYDGVLDRNTVETRMVECATRFREGTSTKRVNTSASLPLEINSILIQFEFNCNSILIHFEFNCNSVLFQFQLSSNSIPIQFEFNSNSVVIQL